MYRGLKRVVYARDREEERTRVHFAEWRRMKNGAAKRERENMARGRQCDGGCTDGVRRISCESGNSSQLTAGRHGTAARAERRRGGAAHRLCDNQYPATPLSERIVRSACASRIPSPSRLFFLRFATWPSPSRNIWCIYISHFSFGLCVTLKPSVAQFSSDYQKYRRIFEFPQKGEWEEDRDVWAKRKHL